MTTFITKLINITLITFLTAFVGLASAMFFLGSEESYQTLLKTLPSSFTRRALGGISIGLLGSGILVLTNYLFYKVIKSKLLISLEKIFWWTLFITSSASIVGTFIFFSH